MTRILPKEADLVDYDFAVAGHDGTLADASGELFIKPCTLAEVSFYEDSVANHSEFAFFMPTYLGTLELTPRQDATVEEHAAVLLTKFKAQEDHGLPKNRKIVTNKAVVLENATFGYKKPNILDVKLGVRLWADDAEQDKKDRFNKVTAETTHRDLGFRIAGMRVWQGHDALCDGTIDPYGFKIYDKGYGRFKVTSENVMDAFRNFFFTKSAGVDEELGMLIAQAFYSELIDIQKVLEGQESRMFSSSLLFVFEGDGEALRSAMEEASRPLDASTNGAPTEGSDSDGDEDEEDRRPKIFTMKVIDFAHAKWVPGLGPDENSLKGVRSVAKILKNLGSSA